MATNDFVVKNGLDVTENAIIRETTDSSSKDTGALVVEGGVGIEKKLYVGTDLAVNGTTALTGNATLTGDIAVNGGDITTNQTTFNLINATTTTLNVGGAATTLNLGATSGTTNVRNNLNVTGDLDIDGGDLTASTTTFNLINATATTLNIGGAATALTLGATTGTLTVRNTQTVFSSTNSIQVPAGTTAQRPSPLIAGQIRYNTSLSTFEGYGPGNSWVAMIGVRDVDGDTFIIPETSPGANNNVLDFYANGTHAMGLSATLLDVKVGTTLGVANTTDASSTTTGAVQIAGGVGIAKRLYAGSIQNTPIGSSVASTAAFTSLTANGAVTFTQNTASTTTTSGTLVVSGGIGVTGAINTGLSSSFNGLTSTNTTTLSPANAAVNISPTGTGTVTISPASAGTINNVSIGVTTAAAGRFTTLTTTSTATLSPANANVLLQPTGSGTVTIAPATAGTINNMSIGATTATTGRFTTVTSTQTTGTAPFTVASSTVVTNLNSDLLDGFNATTASTVSTVAARDSSGDINVRLVRSEFTNESTISGAMAFRVNNSTDNYIRFCSDTPAIRTFLDVPTRAGLNASGTWGISISGNAATATTASTATTFTTNRTNYKGVTDGAVAGQLMWKEYGNNHTIFDASDSTSPTGTAVNNANSEVVWSSTYPTLMGWNGANTYGVRVDSCRLADTATNANQLGGVAAANFPRSGANNNGDWAFASNTNNARYDFAAFEIRELNFGGSQTGAVSESPRLGFHWGGRVASQIGMETSGRIAILNNPGTGYEAFICGTFTASSITETSSIAYKENVSPIDSALDKVLQLMGVTYDRKDGSSKNEAGLIAEDVARVLPNIVSDKEGKPEGIQYTKLTAYLIECIKELNAKIERLEGKS
jgi:hypothetical protein